MQIIDRKTIAIPGPEGDITPEAQAALDAAEAQAAAAEQSATNAATSAQEAEDWATQAGEAADSNIAELVDDLSSETGQAVERSANRQVHANAVQGGYGPRFVRANGGEPVLLLSDQNPAPDAIEPALAPDLYSPSVINAEAMLGSSALDTYYLYGSSDHATASDDDGIWMFSAPSLMGPWTGRGRVFVDTVVGRQTETPSVIADPTGQYALLMYYHQAATGSEGLTNASQATLWAHSNDGVSWTRGGVSIDVPNRWAWTNGHTGYVKARLYNGQVIAMGLGSGGDYSVSLMSRSLDGRVFTPNPEPIAWQSDLSGSTEGKFSAHPPLRWQGAPWMIGTYGPPASGTAVGDKRIFTAPLSPDLMAIIAPPRELLPDYPQGDEVTNIKGVDPFQDVDGSLWLIYFSNSRMFVAREETTTA